MEKTDSSIPKILFPVSCPKCHLERQSDGSDNGICTKCGLVFQKYIASQNTTRSVISPSENVVGAEEVESLTTKIANTWYGLFEVHNYNVKNRYLLNAALWGFFFLWGIRIMRMSVEDGEMGASFIHPILLPFHEAGHFFFRPFGHFMVVLGGTLGQLLFPIVLICALLFKNRDTFGASIGLWLLGVSTMDVAPYMYDALYPQLTLLNGEVGEAGGHDWIYIFNALHLLQHSQAIGFITHKTGLFVTLFANVWGAIIISKQYQISQTL